MKIRLLVLLALMMSLVAFAQPSIDVNNGVPSIFNVSGAQSTLAPNVVFVIYGHNLGPASIVVAPPPNYPLSLAGTRRSRSHPPQGERPSLRSCTIRSRTP